MVFYNQNDYEHIPYPSEVNPKGNIASSGCGVCSACMIVENMTDAKFAPEEACAFSLACGGRDNSGTDITKLAPAVCEKFGLTCEMTDDSEKALEHLHKGGMIIANPGGDQEDYVGIFTTSGHYIVLASAEGSMVTILDPSLSPTKFDKEGRRGKVEVRGNEVLCEMSIIAKECSNRTPAYVLFSK